jgi:GH15 family glucan-1,4-alpha-glucosidase
MCWAACDRLARIARALGLRDRQRHWTNQAEAIRSHVLRHAETEGGGLAATLDGEGIDASLLLLHDLGFLDADDPCFAATVESLDPLRSGSNFFRYREDDFGSPATSFAVCSFWYIDAINALGRREEARELFQQMLERRNPVGLLSEDLDPETGELWGNFPQTYSMVGLINSALRLSRPWSEAF